MWFPRAKQSILVITKEENVKEIKNYEIRYQLPINTKRNLLVFKIMNYKNYDYSYSEENNNIELATIASNHVLNKKEYKELISNNI